MRLEIRLLGNFEVRIDGNLVTDFESVKVRALLAYLAADAGRPQRRDTLAGLLWPDWPQKSAMSNLRYALSDLRKNIGDREAEPPFLEITRDSIQLNLDSNCEIDAQQFDILLTQYPNKNIATGSLRSAVELYRGAFLELFSLADSPLFEDWVRAKSEYYRQKVLLALEELAQRQILSGEYEQALETSRRAIAVEPWHEPSHRQVIRLLALQGRRAEAVAQYEQLQKSLQDDLKIEPAQETIQLLEQVCSGALQETTQSEITHTYPNNLPVQLTSFIGREKEIERVTSLLIEHRMVTLTGVGGTGKTRLAMQAASEVLDNYPNGTWFVELAQLADPEMVPKTVTLTLGLMETPGKPIADTLVDYLQDKRVLLILDNCEHLLEVCASLANRLLRACPEVTLMATSREILGVMGEIPYLVPPLSMPDTNAALSAENLCECDAVHLFVERTRVVSPDFELSDKNAAAVVEVVRRLDGIPLAIELAAARMRLLGIEQLNQRLNNAFRLLTGGHRTVLPRHQTLRASIDWSYNLLSEPEKVLLRRLSVFSGGWRLGAAEVICADAPGPTQSIHQEDILDLLTELVDKSLAIAVRETEGRRRYRMLETIHQYAHEKLVDEKEAEWMRTRHLKYYLELAETMEPKFRSREQVQTLDQVERELDNIRLALEWGLQTDVEAELQLASALMWFWHIRFYWSEDINWLEKGLALELATRPTLPDSQMFSQTPRALIRAKALFALGLHRGMDDEGQKSTLALEESLALYRQNGIQDSRDMAYVLRFLESIPYGKSVVLAYANEAFEIFQKINDHHGMAECLQEIGVHESDLAQRTKYHLEQLAHDELIGDEEGIATSLQFLGHCASRKGNYDEARVLFLKSREHYKKVGNTPAAAIQLQFISYAFLREGNYQDTVQYLDEALEIYLAIGHEVRYLYCLLDKCLLFSVQGDNDQALKLIEESQPLYQKTDNKHLIAHYAYWFARITRLQGDFEKAFELVQNFLEIAREIDIWYLILGGLVELGEIAMHKNDLDQAQAFLQEGLQRYVKNLDSFSNDQYFSSFAKLAVRRNDMPRAARLFGALYRWCPHIDNVQSPGDRLQRKSDLAAVRQILGDEHFEQLYEEGQAMSLDEVVAYALDVRVE